MDGATTLEDNLLDDLDDLSDVADGSAGQGDVATNDDDEPHNDNDSATTPAGAHTSRGVAGKQRLLNDKGLQRHLEAIRSAQHNDTHQAASSKEREEHEYRLIVTSNKYLAELVQELQTVHGELCEAYNVKFPELEELLPNAIQYRDAVRVIGNEMDMTVINDELNAVLNSNQIITLSVAGSTTQGRLLNDAELQQVHHLCDIMDALVDTQQALTTFVESRMERIAPSVCALVGPSPAAKLLGLAGGLAELSKIPACNLQVLGQVKQNATSKAGLANLAARPHQGVLVECDLVQRVPKAMQKKALKTVAAKLALAARFDFVNAETGRRRSADAGRKFRAEIESKFQKLQEPDKAPTLKALPKPDLTIKKRRGGKNMRRRKERFEETALMKQANTRAFNTEAGEYGDDAMGMTLGLLDTSGVTAGDTVRKVTEKRKMKYANTKASRKKAAQMQPRTSSSSGLASSVAFTAVQGMELVNPEAAKDRVREANKKWFSENAGFQSALPFKK